MIRAKFVVSKITRTFNWKGATIELTPVYSADPEHENKKFWDATPSGSIVLNINNPEAADAFILGEEHYVDFTVSVPLAVN